MLNMCFVEALRGLPNEKGLNKVPVPDQAIKGDECRLSCIRTPERTSRIFHASRDVDFTNLFLTLTCGCDMAKPTLFLRNPRVEIQVL